MNYLKNIFKFVEEELNIKGVNKKNEIARLLYEILKKYNITLEQFLKDYKLPEKINFNELKEFLIKIRYPLSYNKIEKNQIYLPQLKISNEENSYKIINEYKPERIFIEKEALNYELTERIVSKFPGAETIIIDKIKNFKKNSNDYISTLGKENIFLIVEKYDILKKCPCTKNVLSCGYFIFNLGFGCIYDCSYCYLQHYTNSPGIILPVNINEILYKLSNILQKIKIPMRRIGTGEFTDSLMLDNITEYSNYLIPFFEKTEFLLELKTKSANISNILKFSKIKNTIVAWSVNTPYIVDSEEHFTPPLIERLNSAKKLTEFGFKVAFHFDPIVYYDNWEKDYKKVVEKIFQFCDDKIAWISLGTFRFNRSLKSIIEKRFPNNKILDGELFIDPIDNKLRYPQFLRIEIYKKILNWIKKYNKSAAVYLCMEPPQVWKEIDSKFQLPNFK